MIRVLHPITRLIVGGAQENTLYTAALLDRRRYAVEVLSGPQTGSEGSLMDELRSQDIPLIVMPALVRQISPAQDLRALLQMTRLIRAEGYTIVHTHSSKAGLLGRLAARSAGAPVIVHTVHGWSFHDYMPAHTRAAYILLEKLAARISDALIAVAEGDIEKGLRAGIGRREQYVLIRSAIPLDEFNPGRFDRRQVRRELGLPEDALVLGNVGRFSPQKNPFEWVRVAGQVARRLPQCQFLLVGDGPLRGAVEAALVEEGIAGRTLLTGLRRDVPALLAAMDVFLLTSLWEGLPRVIPQALAMGLPVVANCAGGAGEILEGGSVGYLCEAGDIIGKAERCVELLSDPQRRMGMGRRGQELAAQEFDVRKMTSQIDHLYQEILMKKSGLRV